MLESLRCIALRGCRREPAPELQVRVKIHAQLRGEGGVRALDQAAGEVHPALPGEDVAGANATGQAVAQQANVLDDLRLLMCRTVRWGIERTLGKLE